MRHGLQLLRACIHCHGKLRVHKRLCCLRVRPEVYVGQTVLVNDLLSPPKAQTSTAHEPMYIGDISFKQSESLSPQGAAVCS